jgi:threonine dehydrogenase-like Zn-dependent dehydrogenase
MRGVVCTGPGRVEVVEVPEPNILDAADAVVAVEVTSICGSDLHLLDGKTAGLREGAVIGHEFAGTVRSVGANVHKVRPGDRVLGSFLIACGECPSCRSERFNFCANRRALGLGTLAGDLEGAQAEYVRVPVADVNLMRLTGPLEEVPAEIAFLCGDVLTTGFHASALSNARRPERVAVFGAGPIGLACAIALEHRGVDPVMIDHDPGRVRFAGALGFQSATAFDVAPTDVAIDAVGAIPALKSAMRSVRDGGRIVIVGVYGSERYELPMGVAWVRGLDLRFAGMANIQGHWHTVANAVIRREIDPAPLITHHLGLEEAPEAYELFRSRRAVKVVLTP